MTTTLTTATCASCHKAIEITATASGAEWTDGHRSSPTVCFSAVSLRHSPAESLAGAS